MKKSQLSKNSNPWTPHGQKGKYVTINEGQESVIREVRETYKYQSDAQALRHIIDEHGARENNTQKEKK